MLPAAATKDSPRPRHVLAVLDVLGPLKDRPAIMAAAIREMAGR
jgi:hypothetical protein